MNNTIIILIVIVALFVIYKKLTFRLYSDFEIINQVGKLPKDYLLSDLISKPKSAEQKAIRVKVLLT